MKYVVRTSNFIGYMLKEAQRMGYKKILMAGHIGKFINYLLGYLILIVRLQMLEARY